MLTADSAIICPTHKHFQVIAEMVRRDGSARGFFNEGSLIIFRSYGNTHDSMRRHFGLYVVDCFIIQDNGNVWFETFDTAETLLSDAPFDPKDIAIFLGVAKCLGNAFPKCLKWDY